MTCRRLLPVKEGEKLDLSKPFVAIGPYTIQARRVFGLYCESNTAAVIEELRKIDGVYVEVTHTGKQTGWGHGYTILQVINYDGTLIYKLEWVNHCDGPGNACSYSHGPWETFGTYKGNTPKDPDLDQAIQIKQILEAKFRW